jgi:pimeloyl-ACP methyl ester carboxylesterase
VLAGHSFGGLYVLTFAAQYPDQVAGMVLLDSTAPVVGPAPATNRSDDVVGRISMLVAATANLGAAHLLGDSYDSLPPRSRDEACASVSTARSVQSYINEFREGATATHQAATLVDFGSKPLIVITAGREGRKLAGCAGQASGAVHQQSAPCRRRRDTRLSRPR